MMMHFTDSAMILIISLMVFTGVILMHRFKYLFYSLQGGDLQYWFVENILH